MEHLSNRNLIGTFQKLNDRKYHFLRKNEKLYIFGRSRKILSFEKPKTFVQTTTRNGLFKYFFLKILFPGILKNPYPRG